MQKHFADKAEIELVEIKDIPVFNKPADKQVPDAVLDIVAKIEEADGVIIGTPEIRPLYSSGLDECSSLALIRSLPIVEQTSHDYWGIIRYLGIFTRPTPTPSNLKRSEIKANVLPDEFLLSHSLQTFDQNGDLVDLDVIQKLDAIFNDFRVFVKITDKLRNAQELLRKRC